MQAGKDFTLKVILTSQRLVNINEYKETRECLDVRWGAFFRECRLLPVAVPLLFSIDEYFETIKPKGVLLTGGNDLSVCRTGDKLSKDRDMLERKLIHEGIERGIPIIGVCRGMQMIASYFGLSIQKVEGHVDKVHSVRFERNTLFSPHYSDVCDKNSFHEYTIGKMDREFQVIALSSNDGSIEAIQHKEHKIAGIMWHPERIEPFSSSDVSFFIDFFTRDSAGNNGR